MLDLRPRAVRKLYPGESKRQEEEKWKEVKILLEQIEVEMKGRYAMPCFSSNNVCLLRSTSFEGERRLRSQEIRARGDAMAV